MSQPSWNNQPSQWPPPGSFGQRQGWGPPQQYVQQRPSGQMPHPAPGQFGGPPQWGPPAGRPVRRSGTTSGRTRLIMAALAVMVVGIIGTMVIGQLQPGGAGGADVAYANEDYQVPAATRNPPELPIPTTWAEAESWTRDNTLFQQTLGSPVRCEAGPINLQNAGRAQLQNHFNEYMGCLMRVWGPALQGAGRVAVRPSVTIYTGKAESRCGTLPDRNAVYCPADQQVYYAENLPSVIPPDLRSSKFVVEAIMAHEFGHAVQARSGMLASARALGQRNGSDAEQREWDRRAEVQADCFGSMFLRSVSASTGLTDADLGNIAELAYRIGDDQLSGKPDIEGDHGMGRNRRYWSQMGLASSTVAACNTYIAEPNLVR